MEINYKEDVKRLLLIYKYNPEYRDEYYTKLFSRNRNKLLLAMLDLFEEEITKFNYNDSEDITYLFTILELIPDVIKRNQYLQQTTINRFTDIHRNINDIIPNDQKDRYFKVEEVEIYKISFNE